MYVAAAGQRSLPCSARVARDGAICLGIVLLTGCGYPRRTEPFRVNPGGVKGIAICVRPKLQEHMRPRGKDLTDKEIDITRYAEHILPLVDGARPWPENRWLDDAGTDAELVITNPDGSTQRLSILFAYQSPITFRYNGMLYQRDGAYRPVVAGRYEDMYVGEGDFLVQLAEGVLTSNDRLIGYSLNELLITSGVLPPAPRINDVSSAMPDPRAVKQKRGGTTAAK
jgi:hypothetical protein